MQSIHRKYCEWFFGGSFPSVGALAADEKKSRNMAHVSIPFDYLFCLNFWSLLYSSVQKRITFTQLPTKEGRQTWKEISEKKSLPLTHRWPPNPCAYVYKNCSRSAGKHNICKTAHNARNFLDLFAVPFHVIIYVSFFLSYCHWANFA